ncbi:MAG: peptidoglycan-binding domain-containing protein [Hyphomicrobium sp.]
MLTLAERQKLQLLLTAKGYYSGDVDGDLGSGSREAITNYQLKAGLTADGVGSRALLQMLEAGARMSSRWAPSRNWLNRTL